MSFKKTLNKIGPKTDPRGTAFISADKKQRIY